MAEHTKHTQSIGETHKKITSQFECFRIRSSTLSGSISRHELADTITLSVLFAIQNSLKSSGNDERALLCSTDGKINFSVNANYNPSDFGNDSFPSSRKRRRDEHEEQSTKAVQRVKMSCNDTDSVSESCYRNADVLITNLLNLRGTSNECIIESWALSLRKTGQWASSGFPTLVVAVRMSAGVAISLVRLISCISLCSDGMLTTNSSMLSSDFELPMSEQGMSAHRNGQASLLLLLSVPV